VSRGKIITGRTTVARAATWKDVAQLARRIERHDEQIQELLDMSAADNKRTKLQGEGLDLLKKLGENHEKRIAMVERDVSGVRRRLVSLLRIPRK